MPEPADVGFLANSHVFFTIEGCMGRMPLPNLDWIVPLPNAAKDAVRINGLDALFLA